MRFGNQELQQYTRPEEQFHFEVRPQLDPIQNCLIDNIWNILTVPSIANYKITMINASASYFETTIQKPEGKKYSCYAVSTGSQAGVYST